MINSLEPAITPRNKITFLLDWEITMKCNLDCSYCGVGIYRAGHNNNTRHPSKEQCLSAIPTMLEYADIYMQTKPAGLKTVVLNVYGGESLYHPNIIEILTNVKDLYDKNYANKWELVITCTTNLIIKTDRFHEISNLVDEFTCSFHTESTDAQKQQFKDNLEYLQQQNKRHKVIILAHTALKHFDESIEMVEYCKNKNIPHLLRKLDNSTWDDSIQTEKWHYNKSQLKVLNSYFNQEIIATDKNISATKASNLGRACCGGRQLCANKDYKHKNTNVNNRFKGWSCSVNHFFVFFKQLTNEVFVSKDCGMHFDGTPNKPIGNIDNPDELLALAKKHANNPFDYTITCAKDRCHCGLCAPKASNVETYNDIFKKYLQKG